MFERTHQFLASKSQSFILMVGLSLVVLIGALDYVTWSNFEIDFFYVLPLYVVTWFASTEAAIATAVLITLVWTIIDRVTNEIPLIWIKIIWNASIELAFFLTIVSLLLMLKRDRQRLEGLANEDHLTGAANRRSFYRAVAAEMKRSQRFSLPFSVAYMDIDNFKAINDTQGHNAGDALLREVAVTLQQHIRDIDTVGRLGGDEFALLLIGLNAEVAKQTIERIQCLLLEAMANKGWSVTFSIGVVSFSKPPISFEEMVEITDAVMYAVKSSGKNRIAFESWPRPEIVSQ